MKIGMTSIFVSDPVAAFEFYTNVLGFSKKFFIAEAGLAIVVSPDDQHGTSLLLEPNDNPIAKAFQEGLFNSNIPAIVFTSADVSSECNRLSKAGVKFRKMATVTEYGVEALFEDGFGNVIQLFQA